MSIGGAGFAPVISAGAAPSVDTDTDTDTDPDGAGNLVRTHHAGTSVCRVDVVSFAVDIVRERSTIDGDSGSAPST